jgi:hypothetical protein
MVRGFGRFRGVMLLAMVDPSALLEGRTRETKIRRDAEGRWYNDGVEIVHQLLTRAFDQWLVWAPDGSGRYCLSNDVNWAYVSIEGAPRFVRSVHDGMLRLSDGKEIPLDPKSLRQGKDGALYCDAPENMVARFDRHAIMQLSDYLGEDDRGVYVEVDGQTFRPPIVDDPLAARGSAA